MRGECAYSDAESGGTKAPEEGKGVRGRLGETPFGERSRVSLFDDYFGAMGERSGERMALWLAQLESCSGER